MSAPSVQPTAQTQRDLAVAAMNRGHALSLGGDPAGAIAAYAEAVALLEPLVGGGEPAGDTPPSWVNSLAAAFMNRGQLLHRVSGTARAAGALAAFDRAAALLRSPACTGGVWPRRNLAGTLLNRANLLLDLARCAEARTAAHEALGLVQAGETIEAVDADLALKARRTLCDALGQLLVAPGADQEALAREAGDLADEALALIRAWNQRGPAAQFRPLAVRFFRFGARLYRVHQPHFLAEFLTEQLDAAPQDGEFRAIALENIDAILRDDGGAPVLTVGDPGSERRLQTWRELRAIRPRLADAGTPAAQPSHV